MKPGKKAQTLTPAQAERIRRLVAQTAKEYRIPAAYIPAHIQTPAAHAARLHVWRVMIVDMRLLRTHVARIFWRSERRLRKSVLGF